MIEALRQVRRFRNSSVTTYERTVSEARGDFSTILLMSFYYQTQQKCFRFHSSSKTLFFFRFIAACILADAVRSLAPPERDGNDGVETHKRQPFYPRGCSIVGDDRAEAGGQEEGNDEQGSQHECEVNATDHEAEQH
jgi:hypothetical protein